MVNRVAKSAGIVAFIALSAALVIWEFGGGSIRISGWLVSARSWERPFVVGVIAAATFIYYGGRTALEQWIPGLRRMSSPPILAAVLSLGCATASFFYGAHIAGGADSYGYISQADLWRHGSLHQLQPFARDASWPNAQWSFTPLGYRPSVSGDAIVPSYSAGYPLLIAAGQLVAGQLGAFLIVPLCFAIAIWATYRLGELVCSPACGLIAAVLLTASPAVAYMTALPMSDIPAMAFWTLALAAVARRTRAAPLLAGLSASVAILIRPNLFPAAGVMAVWLLFEHAPIRRRLAAVGLLALGALPGMAATAVINARLYGSPLKSGYGDLETLFSPANISLNLGHWLTWLSETETWFIFLAVVPLIVPLRALWKTRDNRTLALLGPFALSIVLVYISYKPFDAWWYLRFLLPVFPPLLVAAGVVIVRAAGANPWRVAGVGILVIMFGLHLAHRSVEMGLLAPRELEGRYYNVAKFIDTKTAPNAMFISMQHSGSLRYYAHRLTMRFEWLDEKQIPNVLEWSRRHGVHPYVVLEDWELPIFKERFPTWSKELEPSLVFGYGGAQQVFVYDPAVTNARFEQIPADPIPLIPRPMPDRNNAPR